MAEEDKTSRDQLTQIDERLKYLESIVRETVGRLYFLETRLGVARREPGVTPEQPQKPESQKAPHEEPQPPPVLKPAPPSPQATPPAPPPTSRGPVTPPPPPVTRPPASTQPPPAPAQPPTSPRASVLGLQPPQGPPPRGAQPTEAPYAARTERTVTIRRKSGSDLESRIGGNWFNRIGVVAIILGVGFFFKYAYDNHWINRWGWVSIGIALGIAFLIGGEKTRKKYPSYAYGLTGCGISLLYVSVFAAYTLWSLVPHLVAFAMMAIVTATASLLAARYNALAIALLGLIGGFLTPILLPTGHDNEPGLFGYIALLDAGVLALAYRKQWRSLNYLAFGGTVLMFIAWAHEFYEPAKLGTTVIFLTVFFAIFALLAVLYNVVNRRPTTWLDLGLVFANAVLYFGTTYGLLEDEYYHVLGAFAIFVAAFYLGLGYFTFLRDREDTLLVHTFLGLAFLFSVLAVPIQFDQHWVTMAWAVEGAVMTWVGLRAKDGTSRYAGLIVFVIATTHWLRVDVHDFAYQTGQRFVPVLNARALSCAVLVASLAAAARLYHSYRDDVDENERSMLGSLYILAANAAAILLLSLDANDYFIRSREIDALNGRAYEIWSNSRQFTLSALWTVYGVVTLVVGITRNQKVLRAIAGVLLSLATLKVLAVDLVYYQADWHLTLLNQTFASLMMLVFGLAASAWFYSRSKVDMGERRFVLPALILVSNILALIALTTEPMGYFSRTAHAIAPSVDLSLDDWMHFTLTAIWTVYAAIAFAIGVRRKSKPVRMGALLLLAFSAAKLLLVNARYYYSAPWHKLVLLNQTFGAFALLIAALALASYLYSRTEEAIEGERRTFAPLLVGAANLLAVTALSLEAIGYFNKVIDAVSPSGDSASVMNLDNSMHFTLTVIWAVYAAAALAIAFRRNSKLLRVGALLLLALGVAKTLVVDSGYYGVAWHELALNQTFGSFVVLIAVLSLASYIYSREDKVGREERDIVAPLVVGVANLLALIAMSLEAIGYFKRHIHVARELTVPIADIMRLENSMHFALTAIWTVYAAAAIVIGVRRNSGLIRKGALLLLCLASVKVLLADVGFYDAGWHSLVFNQTFGAFALLIAALSLAVLSYSRSESMDLREHQVIVPLLVAFANILAIIGLSAEGLGHYAVLLRGSGLADVARDDLRLAQQLSLSVIWTVYGGGMLMVGIWRRSRLLRIMALVLLSGTILKVFLIDLARLESIYRIISFIVLGAILLAVSYLYQRYRQRTSELTDDSAGELPPNDPREVNV